ncbi:Uncharacterized protein QTN25_001158 [Entamoeba marina]
MHNTDTLFCNSSCKLLSFVRSFTNKHYLVSILFIFTLCVTPISAYESLFSDLDCSEYSRNCRECVRYVSDFQDHRRGCEWCNMPNYFKSYCFNPNTTTCKGEVEDVCKFDPYMFSLVIVLCMLPLCILIIWLVFPTIMKFVKKAEKED